MEKGGGQHDPIKLEDGWHIIKLIDTKASYTRPLSEVADSSWTDARKRARCQSPHLSTELIEKNPTAINELALSRHWRSPANEPGRATASEARASRSTRERGAACAARIAAPMNCSGVAIVGCAKLPAQRRSGFKRRSRRDWVSARAAPPAAATSAAYARKAFKRHRPYSARPACRTPSARWSSEKTTQARHSAGPSPMPWPRSGGPIIRGGRRRRRGRADAGDASTAHMLGFAGTNAELTSQRSMRATASLIGAGVAPGQSGHLHGDDEVSRRPWRDAFPVSVGRLLRQGPHHACGAWLPCDRVPVPTPTFGARSSMAMATSGGRRAGRVPLGNGRGLNLDSLNRQLRVVAEAASATRFSLAALASA